MRHLILGYGEVGKAIHEILPTADYVDIKVSLMQHKNYDILHVCIPYSDRFTEIVRKYVEKYDIDLIIVHSTVVFGTTSKLGVEAVHSPIRGVHPHLAEGIRTFIKYFGGPRAEKASKIFSEAGCRVETFPKPETTEAMKLWDTTQYGWNIVIAKYIHDWCKDHGVDYEDVYVNANKDYNEGYTKLGMPHVVRPWLKYVPGPIGGHCVIPNCKLLLKTSLNYIVNVIATLNFSFGKE